MTPPTAREIAKIISEDSLHMSQVHIKGEIERALIKYANSKLEEAATMVDTWRVDNMQADIVKNRILALKEPTK